MKQKAEVSQKGLADPDARLAEGKSLAEGPWAKLISKQSAEGVRHPDAIAFFQAYAQAIDAGTHGNRTVEGWSLGCFYSRPSGKLNVIISRCPCSIDCCEIPEARKAHQADGLIC